MSKTRRNVPHERWFRRPKTHAYRRDLIACEEEIRSELGPNYLAGNFAQINTIPTAYEDLLIQARFEDKPKDLLYAEIYENKVFGPVDKSLSLTCSHSILFDTQKNVFRAWRTYITQKQKVNYLPFVIKIGKKQYPVKIKIDWWYD